MIEGMEPNNTTATADDKKKKKDAADAAAAPATDSTTTTASANTTTTTKPPGSEPSQSDNETSMEQVTAANGNTKSNKNITENLSNLSPAPVGSEGNSMLDLQKGMAKGYGAQKEQAYKALASLGGAGAAGAAGANTNMSSDALSQQSEMINNLKSIQPILDTAEKFLDKFENSSISKMFSNMGSIPGMSLLTGGLGKTASPAAPVGAES